MTAIIVALITAVIGPVVLFVLTRRDAKQRIGTPNGQGNLVQMIEGLYDRLAEHQEQDATSFAKLEARLDAKE